MENTKFGVEFEFLIPDGYTFEEFAGVLKYVGSFDKLRFTSDDDYCGNKTSWFIHCDFSIGGKTAGMEISSPILSGQKGLKEVANLLKILNKFKCTVNKTCGLHVHVNTEKLNEVEKLSILARYSKLENEIDMFVAPHRRKNKSQFASKIKFSYIEDILFNELPYSDYLFTDKYLKVSIHDCYPTVEFRQHEGSLDEKKVLNWIQFCVNFRNQTVKQFKTLNRKNDTCEDVIDNYNELDKHKSVYGLKPSQVRYLNKVRRAA